MCGSLAGIIAAFCTYPLDLVRARMAVTQRGRYVHLGYWVYFEMQDVDKLMKEKAVIGNGSSLDSKGLLL